MKMPWKDLYFVLFVKYYWEDEMDCRNGRNNSTFNVLVRKLNRSEYLENIRIDKSVIWTFKVWFEQAWT
jgi:hypothetical protein